MSAIASAKPATVLNSTFKLVLPILGAFLFNLLFWNEKMALNTSFYFLFVVLALIHFYPKAFLSPSVGLLLFASCFCLAMVVWRNTELSKLAFCCSLCMLAAYCQYVHRSVLYAGASILQSFLFSIPNFFASFVRFFSFRGKKTGAGKKLRLIILPLGLAAIFFAFYFMANKVFANITQRIADHFNWLLEHIINLVEPQRLLFLLLGLFVGGGLLIRYAKAPAERAEISKQDGLERKRKTKYGQAFQRGWANIIMGKMATGPMALKYELRTGILCLLLLNGLLLFVNGTDVMYVWFNRVYKADMDWAKYVHEGAELLVFSILLAMAVVLFFFRGNLNFFTRNKALKYLAYLWLFQNAILAISVCIRNMYYIAHMGLAYKRVGLFFYIMLVLVGLVTIAIKITKKKSAYFLWRVNAAAAFVLLVAASAVDWDLAIAQYNISKKDSIVSDIGFLLKMNDHVIPLLKENKSWICKQCSPVTDPERMENVTYDNDNRGADKCEQIGIKEFAFLEKQKQYDWLSWNLADKATIEELQKIK